MNSNTPSPDYDEFDNLIKNNKESDDVIFGYIRSFHLKEGKKIYNQMKNIENTNTSYVIFGGSGLVTYGLYKSKQQIIYLIKVYLQDPTDYVKVDEKNENLFDL